MYKNGSIQRSNIRTYKLVLISAKKKLICDPYKQYLFGIIIVARWMYENGSIQRSYIRTYELVFK